MRAWVGENEHIRVKHTSTIYHPKETNMGGNITNKTRFCTRIHMIHVLGCVDNMAGGTQQQSTPHSTGTLPPSSLPLPSLSLSATPSRCATNYWYGGSIIRMEHGMRRLDGMMGLPVATGATCCFH